MTKSNSPDRGSVFEGAMTAMAGIPIYACALLSNIFIPGIENLSTALVIAAEIGLFVIGYNRIPSKILKHFPRSKKSS